MWARFRNNFFAQDLLFIGFAGGLVAWTLLAAAGLPHYIHAAGEYAWARENLGLLTAKFAGLLGAYVLLQRLAVGIHRRLLAADKPLSAGPGALYVAYSLAPLFLVPVIFQLLNPFIAAVSGVPPPQGHPTFDPAAHYDRAASWWDLELVALEVKWFGVYLPQWVRQYQQPWLTGVLIWLYVSYFAAPVVAILPPILRGHWKTVREGSALVMACLFLTFCGHMLFPATSPRYLGGPEAWLPSEPGWFGAEQVAHVINSMEIIRWDAFPSGHTAAGLVCLVFALKHQRRIGLAYAPCVAGVIIATVYLGYHHTLDVLAGMLLVPVVFLVVGPVLRWWDRALLGHPATPGPASH